MRSTKVFEDSCGNAFSCENPSYKCLYLLDWNCNVGQCALPEYSDMNCIFVFCPKDAFCSHLAKVLLLSFEFISALTNP